MIYLCRKSNSCKVVTAHHLMCRHLLPILKNKIGEKWGNFLRKRTKTVLFGPKTCKIGRFLRLWFDSDSVIRWFESSYPSHNCRRKGCKTKKPWKTMRFHGFLLFKRQKWTFLKSGAKIRFYGCFFVNYQKNRIWTVDIGVTIWIDSSKRLMSRHWSCFPKKFPTVISTST